MSNSYRNKISTTETYLDYLYRNGFCKSKYLSDSEVIEICNKIGVFKFKGYVKEIKQLTDKHIDDALLMYFFDKYFSKILFDLSSRLEAKLKSILINECYKRTNNHFFYLMERNHKWNNYRIDIPTIKNWENLTSPISQVEAYSHYILFYLQNYNFNDNKNMYLQNISLINIDDTKYNYPPFKYLIESATLGSVISFIQSLKIGSTDIYIKVAENFGLGRNDVFLNYLKRLNEIRNRIAHGGRIFNRTFRSATGISKYQAFRIGIDNHKSMDIFLFLFFLLGQLEDYKDMREFEKHQIKKLFREFKKDYISNKDSLGLIKQYKRNDFEKIERIIFEKMTR